MKPRILIYGHDSSLLDTRGALARSAGFDVLSAYTLSQAETLIETESADALILCQTVSSEEDQGLVLKGRNAQPTMKFAVLSANHGKERVPDGVATVDVWNGPEAFIKMLRTLVVAT
jgi:DNA-binding response OmpR family regulator